MSNGEGIDLDRGVIKRTHQSGMQVCMYKDQPGTYYDVKGRPLSSEVARQAGFAVDRLAKQRERNAQMELARQRIDREFEEEEQRLAHAAAEGREGIEIKPAGRGKYAIYRDSERLTGIDLTIDEAEALLSSLFPEDDDNAGNPQDNPPEANTGGAGEAPAAARPAAAGGAPQAQQPAAGLTPAGSALGLLPPGAGTSIDDLA